MPAFVYRLSDAEGALLYVGSTTNLPQRLADHAAQKVWWPEVADVSATPYPTIHVARTAEVEAIRTLRPRHNRITYGHPVMQGGVVNAKALARLGEQLVEVREDLYAGVQAAVADGGMSEVEAARVSRLSRNTVRRILGKPST